MKTFAKCLVCFNADRRRLIEAGWNAGMGADTIARVFDGAIGAPAILKHIKEHAEGDGRTRNLSVEPDKPMRERVYNLQRLQLDEVERRIEMAKTRADMMNRERENLKDADGNAFPPVDWSDFYDILDQKSQSAIGTILKTQGLVDNREKAQGDLKLGLFEAMASAGLAPKALVGGVDVKLLEPGEDG